MGKPASVRALMEKLHAAHQKLQRVRRENQDDSQHSSDATSLAAAQEKLLATYRRLFEDHLAPLDARFRSGEEQAVDEVIDFLEIDIPALRCGYVKEKWLRQLKTTPLNSAQRQRMSRAALAQCASLQLRREMAAWNRLMIKLVDDEFIVRAIPLLEADYPIVKNKTWRMLHTILNSRHDLVRGSLRYLFLFSYLQQEANKFAFKRRP
jgi:hypothetical protein